MFKKKKFLNGCPYAVISQKPYEWFCSKLVSRANFAPNYGHKMQIGVCQNLEITCNKENVQNKIY